MVLAFLEMMEVMLLPIMRKRLRKSISFQKPNPKTATAQQFFSRERTGCTPTILISAEGPMKCSYFYSTISTENHMQSLHNRTVIVSPVKPSLVPSLEF